METACYDSPNDASAAPAAGRTGLPVDDRFESTSLERWVERARAGEVGAFEELYRHSVGRIYALCLRMTGNAQEAEEATQDAFVRAWEKLDTFDGRSAFTSWLHRLAVNVVLGRWRSAGRHRNRVVAIDDVVAEQEQPAPPAGVAIDLERAIATLPDGARTVFVLYDLEGYGHREIAEMTGLASGTSKAQLHRARQLLRKALDR